MKVHRLYPPPGREVSGIYEDLNLPPPWHGDSARPYVIVNMVSSVDEMEKILIHKEEDNCGKHFVKMLNMPVLK